MEFKALSELATIIMGQSPKKEEVNKREKGAPLLNGPTEFGNYCPIPVQFTESPKKIAPKGSLLFCVRGSTTGKMNWADQDYAIGRGLAAIIPKDENMKMYIRDSLEKNLESILSSATGSTFPNVSSNLLNSFLIPLSKGSINSSLFLEMISNKILVNEEIIQSLEEIVQTLFKRWFIDFEFPNEDNEPYKLSGGEMRGSELGEIPENWAVKSLIEIADYQNGLAMQKYRPINEEKTLPVMKIKELNQGFIGINSERCIADIKESVKVYNGDVIFSWSGTLLVKIWVGGNAGLNQHLFKVTSEYFPKWFYYCWTKYYLKRFKAIAADKATTMGHINRSHLVNSKVVVPPEKELMNFSGIMNPLITEIIEKGIEIEKLQELRSTLLPKLLSGEIDFPDDTEVNKHVPIS